MRDTFARGLLAACLVLSTTALADTTDDGAGAAHVWTLTDYLKGTPAQIREKLNNEVNRLVEKVNDVHRQIKAADAATEADTKAAIAKLHKSADYQQAVADENQASTDLDAARKSGSPEDRVAASSRFNKARDLVAQLDRDVLAKSATLEEDRKRSADLGTQFRSFKLSLAKAQSWRDDLVDATRNRFRMKGPVRELSAGTLPHLIVRQIVDPHHAVFEYEALEIIATGGQAEGLTSATARSHLIKILISDLDTHALKEGQTVDLDQNYVIKRRDRSEDGILYVAQRQPSDVDALFEQIDAPCSRLQDEPDHAQQ